MKPDYEQLKADILWEEMKSPIESIDESWSEIKKEIVDFISKITRE